MEKNIHLIIDCSNIPADICVNDRFLLETLTEAAKKAKANIINTSRYRFGHNSPPGCTVFIMLDESHISLHSYADERKIALDIFTCGNDVDPKAIFDFIRKELKIKNFRMKTINRFR